MQGYHRGGVRAGKTGCGLLAAFAAALLSGACSANLGDIMPTASLGGGSNSEAVETAQDSRSELDKAVQHWGRQFEKNPRDAKAALAYAKNLKAAGRKPEALAVMQQASVHSGGNREIASEYGRLALEAGQVGLAQKLLAHADDPGKPDWRVISARGTALAKQGSYSEAIPFFERASALAPTQPSVLNNLALAYAANGQPGKAEELLRRASASGGDVVVRQNLALVVGLQGKYQEARVIAAADMPAEAAAQDIEFVRAVVRVPENKSAAPVIQAKSTVPADKGLRGKAPDVQMATGGWDTKVAAAK